MTYQIIFVDHLLAAVLEGSMAVPRRFRVKTSPPMHGLEESDSGILPETPAKKPKRKAHVLACTSEILPPARTAYALFFASVYDSVKEGVQSEDGGRYQRLIVSEIGQRWKDLADDERQSWIRKSAQEKQHRQDRLRELCQLQPASAPSRNVPDQDVKIGNWVIKSSSAPIWSGTQVTCVRARHDRLHLAGMALVFREAEDFQKEIEILNKLAECSSPLILKMLQPVAPEHPLKTILLENLVTAETAAPFEAERLVALSKQMAAGLWFLHDHGYWHLDIRPQSFFWTEERQCAKLGRFSTARMKDDKSPLIKPAYAGNHRPPELWENMDKGLIGEASEAWAFGVTLAECILAGTMFTAIAAVVKFKGPAKDKFLQRLSANHRFVVSQLLQLKPVDRMAIRDFGKSEELMLQLAVAERDT